MHLQIGERPLPVSQPVGALRRPMRRFAQAVVNLGSTSRAHEGVIDLRSRRYMLFGAYAQMYADGTHWGGRPGRPLSSLTRDRASPPVALWLFDLLQLITDAYEIGCESIRETSCDAYSADLDVSRLPPRWRTETSPQQLQVYIDRLDDVRRIQIHAEQRVRRIDLWDHGLDVEDLDWSRLPTEQAAR